MAEAASILCTLCQEDDLTCVAVCWCTDCETFLCVDCEKHHGKIKSSKHHVTINVDEYLSLPSFILNTSNRCEDHDFRYEFYCKYHDRVCCIKCTADMHKQCRDIQPISEVFGNIKSSSSTIDSETRLKDVIDDFETLRACLSNRLISLQSQKDKYSYEVDLLKQSLIDIIDGLQKQFIDELNNEHDFWRAKTDMLLTEIQNKEKCLKTMQTDIPKMRKYATNLQTHLGLKFVEQVTKDETNFLKRLQHDEKLNNVSLEFTISSRWQSVLMTSKDTFGKVVLVTNPNYLQFKSKSSIPIQQVLRWNLNDKTGPKLLRTFRLPKNTSATTGCQIFSNKRVIAVGRAHNFPIVFKTQQNFETMVQPDYFPQDICNVKDNIAGVTYPSVGKICLVNVTNDKVINQITVENCGAIDSDGKTIVVTSNDNIVFVKPDGNEIRRTTGSQISHIALHNKNVYYTNRVTGTLSCQTIDGSMRWEVRHDEAVKPAGIALDKDGYIYVACCEGKNVVKVSPDGKQCRILLSKSDGPEDPFALSIDRKTSKLLVCQLYGKTAFIFQI